jgi:hypothetical protein
MKQFLKACGYLFTGIFSFGFILLLFLFYFWGFQKLGLISETTPIKMEESFMYFMLVIHYIAISVYQHIIKKELYNK